MKVVCVNVEVPLKTTSMILVITQRVLGKINCTFSPSLDVKVLCEVAH